MDAIAEGRLNQELQVIQQLDLSGFFLVLWDIHRFAINAGHVIILDGPASGSLVVHQLGLSPVNPIQHRLLFERFLDPNQTFAPMQQFSISEGGQEEVVCYARARFGWDDIDKEDRLWRAYSQEWQSPSGGTTDRATIDIAVHPGLSVIKQTVQLIRNRKGPEIIPSGPPENDKKTLELFQQGDTEGVYCFQDCIIQDILKKMKVGGISDLIAALALDRDGNFYNGLITRFLECQTGRTSWAYPHHLVDEILEETYGVILYQEQIMDIVKRIGGMDLRDGLMLQKAVSMAKHKQKQINQIRERFANGAKEKQIDSEVATSIFESITIRGKHTVCKANNTIAAFIGYQMAFLKAHHPEEFASASKSVRPS